MSFLSERIFYIFKEILQKCVPMHLLYRNDNEIFCQLLFLYNSYNMILDVAFQHWISGSPIYFMLTNNIMIHVFHGCGH